MSFLRTATGLAVFALVLAIPYVAQSYSAGAPSGFNGFVFENGEPRTCSVGGCHDSYATNSGTGGVVIQAPSSVMAGQTVPITVIVTNTTSPAPGSMRRQGFLASVRDHPQPLPGGQGAFLGTLTLTDAVNTKEASGDPNYVTHTQTGNSQTSWTFDWTAPFAATTATVYVAGNAANGGDLPTEPGNTPAGDYIYTATASISVMPSAADDGPGTRAFDLAAPHPNPASGPAVVRLTLGVPSVVTVTVVDGRGRTVREVARGTLAAGSHPVVVQTAGLAPGTYFVVAEGAGTRRTQPLVVVR